MDVEWFKNQIERAQIRFTTTSFSTQMSCIMTLFAVGNWMSWLLITTKHPAPHMRYSAWIFSGICIIAWIGSWIERLLAKRGRLPFV